MPTRHPACAEASGRARMARSARSGVRLRFMKILLWQTGAQRFAFPRRGKASERGLPPQAYPTWPANAGAGAGIAARGKGPPSANEAQVESVPIGERPIRHALAHLRNGPA